MESCVGTELMQLVGEKTLRGFLSKVHDLFRNANDNKAFVELFVDAGKAVSSKSSIIEMRTALLEMFSEENLKEMSRNLIGVDGFGFHEILHRKLIELMRQYEIPEEEAEAYIHHFCSYVINHIRYEDPVFSIQAFLASFREAVEAHSNRIEKKLDSLMDAVSRSYEECMHFETIASINHDIRLHAWYPDMSLAFFMVDDDEFTAAFRKRIDARETMISVSGQSRLETLYRVLNLLDSWGLSSRTFVVRDFATWMAFERKGGAGLILIPDFNFQNAYAIAGNSCICIFSNEERNVHSPIKLRNRTRHNLVASLEKAGVPAEMAYLLVEKTNGVYSAMEQHLFNVLERHCPKWAEDHSDAVVAALLCGQWKECDEDCRVLERLTGQPYPEYRKALAPYIDSECPLITRVKEYYEIHYRLSCYEDAWTFLAKDVSPEIWMRFLSICRDAFFQLVGSGEGFWGFDGNGAWGTGCLLSGISRTLCLAPSHSDDSSVAVETRAVISDIVASVSTCTGWAGLSPYLADFCEAAPDVMMNRMEQEKRKDTGFVDVFRNENCDNDSYVYILSAIEVLLQIEEYAPRAVRLLFWLNSFCLTFRMMNSPKMTLTSALAIWHNETALKPDVKKSLVRKLMGEYPEAWNIIFDCLPHSNAVAITSVHWLRYRSSDVVRKMNVKDFNSLAISYLETCIEHCGTDAVRWALLLERIFYFDDSLVYEFADDLDDAAAAMGDRSRFIMKQGIRRLLNRHRRFPDAEWSAAGRSDVIQRLEKSFLMINFDTPEYDYVYLFEDYYSFPLVNPVPTPDGKHIDENKSLWEREVDEKVDDFKRMGLSLSRLLDFTFLSITGQNYLGYVLARHFSKGAYDEDVALLLQAKDKDGDHLVCYLQYVLSSNGMDFRDALEVIKRFVDQPSLIARLIASSGRIDQQVSIVLAENDDVQACYWREYINTYSCSDLTEEVFWQAISACMKYGAFDSCVSLIYRWRDNLDEEQLVQLMAALPDKDDDETSANKDHRIVEILQVLQKPLDTDLESIKKISRLELQFQRRLTWKEMTCTRMLFQMDPRPYAQLVRAVFPDDDGNRPADTDDTAIRMCFNAGFCPGEVDGRVDSSALEKWVDGFQNLLISQNQSRRIHHFLGRLFAHSPSGMDGLFPCEAVRKFIEDLDSPELESSYLGEVINMRGIYSFSAGLNEKKLSIGYKDNANGLRVEWPCTARMYDRIAEYYLEDSKAEREIAEHGL